MTNERSEGKQCHETEQMLKEDQRSDELTDVVECWRFPWNNVYDSEGKVWEKQKVHKGFAHLLNGRKENLTSPRPTLSSKHSKMWT